MAEVFLQTYFYIIGILFFRIIFRKHEKIFRYVSAFLWGAGIWVALSYGVLILDLKYTLINITILAFSLFLILLILNQRIEKISFQELCEIIGYSFLFTTLIKLLSIWDLTHISGDSITHICTVRKIHQLHSLRAGVHYIERHGSFMLLIQSLAPFIDLIYLKAFQPALFLSFAVSFFYSLIKHIKKSSKNKVIYYIYCTVITLITITTPLFYILFFNIQTNSVNATYLFLCISCFSFFLTTEEPKWLESALISIFIFSFTRVEAPIVGLILLFYILTHEKNKLSILRKMLISTIYCVIMFIWFFFQSTQMQNIADYMSLRTLFGLLFLYTTVPVIIWMHSYANLKNIINTINLISSYLIGFIGIIWLILCIIGCKFYWVFNAVYIKPVIIKNFLFYGKWGYTTQFIIAGIVMVLYINNSKIKDFFTPFLLVYLSFILILSSQMRVIVGAADSANRIFLSWAIIMLFYVGVSCILGKENKKN